MYMVKNIIYIWCLLSLCLSNLAFGQVEVAKDKTNSKVESDIDLKDSAVEIQFQNIQQNLLEVTGKNTPEEAIEYYNLGELFVGQGQPKLAISYYLQSIEINNTPKKKTKKKRKAFSSFSSSKFNEYKAYVGLINACLAANESKKALQYTEEAERKYKTDIDLTILKLDVLQANAKWQEILNLCDVLESQKHSKRIDSVLINKRLLAKAKLGLDEGLLFTNSLDQKERFNAIDDNDIIMEDVSETEKLDISDHIPIEQNENIQSQNSLNSNSIKTLSYETQDEIANTYNFNKEFGKELIVREAIAKDSSLSEKKKAKQKLEIAKIYTKTSETQKAISALKESLELAKESEDIDVQKETLLKLIDLNESDKDDANALKYYKELRILSALEDSINLEKYNSLILSNTNVLEKQEAIKNIQERRDLYQKEKTLEDKESNFNESQIQFEKIVIACLLLGLLIALLVVIWYHRQRKQLRMVNLQLELKNMRNQMNPHFIFNSLNAVNHFIAQRNELLANEYLTEFALLMRNTLNQSDLDLIPLRDELAFLNRYCELEKMRFENKFDFSFTVDPSIDIDAYQIPPLLLQPFVENAVWHGLRYLENKGQMDVSFKIEGEQLKIEITDNGIGRDKSRSIKTDNQKKHKSKGVSLIKRRIHISNQLTPVHIQWEIQDNIPQGTRVVLLLNKK